MARTSSARAPERRSTRVQPNRPELRVVEAPARDRIRPARVGTVAGVLLFVALFGVAAFQTVLIRAQDRLDELNRDVAEQTEAARQLELELADLQAPDRIAREARDRLGMIAPYTVTFLEPTPHDDAAATYEPPAPPATGVTPSTSGR
jgi:cell division protein FtsL